MQPDRPAAALAEMVRPGLEVLLRSGIQTLKLELSDGVVARLLAFLELLRKWNAVYNLTSVRDPAAMLTQHVLDSLAVVNPLRRHLDLDRACIADVGSGAGLPGLILALTMPGVRILSVEPVGKKTAFQQQVCAELALTNVEIYTGRAESLNRPVDLVISRAFASLDDFRRVSVGLMGPQTVLVALKGQRKGVDLERQDLPADIQVEVVPIAVPGMDAERNLVLMRPPQ